MRYIILLVIIFFACASSRIDGSNKKAYKVYKIDSINSYYLIYGKKGDSLYKIVSKKAGVVSDEKIELHKSYEFEIRSVLSNRKIGNVQILPQNSLLVECFSYDDTTEICLEGDSIRDLSSADNVKGLYFLKNKK